MPPPVSDGSLIAFGLLAAAVAIRKVYRMVTSPREKSKRRLAGTRRTRTGELHNGLARIAGKAVGREVLRSPVTDRACLAFELRVERDVAFAEFYKREAEIFRLLIDRLLPKNGSVAVRGSELALPGTE